MNIRLQIASRKGARRFNEDSAVCSGAFGAIPPEQRMHFDFRTRLCTEEEPVLLAVLDGLGGGEVAGGILSARAGCCMQEAFLHGAFQPPKPGRSALETRLFQAAAAANDCVCRLCGDSTGGTTVCAAAFWGEEAAFLASGDSPAWLMRDGVLRQLYIPQNVASQKAAAGLPVQRGDANCLLSCLGAEENAPEEFLCLRGKVRPGDVLLISSDGLQLQPGRLQFALRHRFLRSAKRLADAAARRKGSDNVTVLIAEVVE